MRIKGKRARYAAELAAPGAGKRVAKFIDAAKEFQDVAGEHQDAVVIAQRLRSLSDKAETGARHLRRAGSPSGRRPNGSAAREAFPDAWKKLERAGKRAW